MKNNFLKALTLLCFTLALGGCNKEGNNRPEASLTPDPLERLRIFRKQIETFKANPEAKSGETITFEDALWGVENNFNLTYSDTEDYYSRINEHEFSLSIPTDAQQKVLVSDAVSLYDQVINQAREALLSDEFIDKSFVSLTVKEVCDNSNGKTIFFSGKTGERSNYNPPIPHVDGPFGDDDNWMFAAPMGKCDDPDIPSGADEQLQEHLYTELIEPFIETQSGFRNIYIERRRFVFDGSTYTGIYYNTDAENLCIEHEYMNDHYYSEKQVITQTIPNQYQLSDYSPISIEIRGGVLNNNALTHLNEVEYGIRMEVSTAEFGEIENLLIQL